MTRLMYNSKNDVLVTRADMAHLVTPPPMGARHKPYSFAEFANTTCDAIERGGFTIDCEEYAVTKDQQRLFGLLRVIPNQNVPAVVAPDCDSMASKYSLLVGLRGAQDQRISRGLAIGTHVIACSNLSFHGDLGNWHTRQTTNIGARIPGLVADAVSGLQQAHGKLTVDFDNFNQRAISRDNGDSILVDIFRSGGFSASQLGRAIEDWQDCSVPEHTASGRNLWWLFNSATAALKPTGANNNHNDLRERSTIIYGKLAAAESSARLRPEMLSIMN
jgi:hypothetical protein